MEALPIHGWAYTTAFHQAYVDLAARYKIPLVPFILMNVIGDPRLMQPDRAHPNAEGARAIADVIWPYLERILATADRLADAVGLSVALLGSQRARPLRLRVSIAFVMRRFLVGLFLVSSAISFHAAAPIRYRLTFPEPQHRWMQVEASFTELGSGTLELRMSRSSPGRYSLHDFAKNVYDVHAFAADGRELDDDADRIRTGGTSPATAAASP